MISRCRGEIQSVADGRLRTRGARRIPELVIAVSQAFAGTVGGVGVAQTVHRVVLVRPTAIHAVAGDVKITVPVIGRAKVVRAAGDRAQGVATSAVEVCGSSRARTTNLNNGGQPLDSGTRT